MRGNTKHPISISILYGYLRKRTVFGILEHSNLVTELKSIQTYFCRLEKEICCRLLFYPSALDGYYCYLVFVV